MLNVIKFIQENSFAKLAEDYGISITSDNEAEPNLVCLNYDQIASPKSHPISQECRGLIINKDTLEIVSRSFDRFYNYGEVPEQTKKVDFSRALTFEKLDGSLINWYYNETRKQFVFGSRGTTTGRSAITKSRHSYHHLICLALGVDVSDLNPLVAEDENWLNMVRYNEYLARINEHLAAQLCKGYTYITELVSPHINIVTQYTETAMYLLGTRHIATGDYINGSFDHETTPTIFSFPTVYPTSTLEEIMEVIAGMSRGTDALQEGVVVFDPANGIRTKLKNTVYLKAHRNLGREIDEKSILELVAANEEAEYLTYYPTDAPLFTAYQEARQQVIESLHTLIVRANECVTNGDNINVIAKWLKDEKNNEFIFPAIKKQLMTGAQVFSAGGENGRIKAVKSHVLRLVTE